MAGDGVARLASLLLVLWPNHIMLVGLASKELMLLFLLSLGVLLVVRAEELAGPARCIGQFAAGLALGAGALTQPTIAILIPAFTLFIWWSGRRVLTALGSLALVLAGAALVVSPWTIRNYLLFGAFIPVSANGGHALLVGNNSEATGGYLPVDKQYLDLDELAYDRLARHLAWRWIKENPGRFLALVPRKEMLFLGDSADGAYWTLKEKPGTSDLRYALAKGLANAYWLAILALMGMAVWKHRQGWLPRDPRVALFMLLYLSFFALFSITESGGRHHIGLSGFGAIIAACALLSPSSAVSTAPRLEPAPGLRRDVPDTEGHEAPDLDAQVGPHGSA
jgi:4-amino-4-deoxy-L-arabinose transferase-like glycosyltransferase